MLNFTCKAQLLTTVKMTALKNLIFLFLLTTPALGSIPCNPRQFKRDSVVCVCNENSCDTLDPLKQSEAGIVQVFESTKDGKRFNYREQRFNDGTNPPGSTWNVKIDHNFSEKFQEIIGFGGAFSDAAVLSIGSLSEKLQREILSSYYGSSGIEYSVGRVVVSGSDFSNRPYTYDDTPYDWDLANFTFVAEDTQYKIPQIKLAREIAVHNVKLFASSWSPPAWLKGNNELNHGGSLNEREGSVFWKTYAKYLLKFFIGYKNAGIDFWGMTIQNEPAIWDPWFPWNTCGFTPEMEAAFVKVDLGPELEKNGFTPDNFVIMCLDHNRNLLPGWVDPIYKDSDASRWIKGTGIHWYGNDAAPPTVFDEVHRNYPDKFLFATEACHFGPDDDKAALGSWEIGQMYAHDILRDLTHWVGGWTDWNLALDMLGGPNWVQNYQSAPIIVNAEANEFYKNPTFYALGHFSKFLPPGSKRVRSDPELNDNERFQTGAFIRPDGAHVVVAINSWDESQVVVINDSVRGEIKISVEPNSFNTYLYY